jgi:hypothetical protein
MFVYWGSYKFLIVKHMTKIIINIYIYSCLGYFKFIKFIEL